MLDEQDDSGLTEIESRNVDFLGKDYLVRVKCESLLNYMKWRRQMNPLYNLLAMVGIKSLNCLDDIMIPKYNDRELKNSWSNTRSAENFSVSAISHDPVLL